jgi:cell division inhibitor SepF
MFNSFKKMFDLNIEEKDSNNPVQKEKEKKPVKVDPVNIENKKTNVIQLDEKKVKMAQENSNINYQMVVYKPYDLYDCAKIGDWIAKDVIVVLNLDDVDTKLAQRVIDFVSGSLYVKGAKLFEISKNVQLCVPADINIKIDDPKFKEANSFYDEIVPHNDAEEIKPRYNND